MKIIFGNVGAGLQISPDGVNQAVSLQAGQWVEVAGQRFTSDGATAAAGGDQHAAATPLPAGYHSDLMQMLADASQSTPLGRYNGNTGARISILGPDDLLYRYPTYDGLAQASLAYPYNVTAILPDRSKRVLKTHADKPNPVDFYLWAEDGEMIRCDNQGRITDGLEGMVPYAVGALATASVLTDPTVDHSAPVVTASVSPTNQREGDGLLTSYPNWPALVSDAVAVHFDQAIFQDVHDSAHAVFPGFGPGEVWKTAADGSVVRA